MWILRVIKGADLADRLVPEAHLPHPLQRFTIGRDPSNRWAIADRTLAISGRHCEIVDSPAGPVLRDLSTNGTFVNGAATRMASDHVLRDGDRIELGPIVISVSGPAMPPRPTGAPSAGAVPAPRAAGVRTTAPQRGGDPAAMQARGAASEQTGLTEMLRVAKLADDSNVDMTKIRHAPAQRPLAPQASAGAAPKPPPSTPHQLPPGQPANQVPPNLVDALARGLGLTPAELAGHDPVRLAECLAVCARSATAALRQLMDQQAQARRSIGSRQSVLLPVRGSNPLRMAGSAEAALLALAGAAGDPAQIMQSCAAELSAHQERLMQAFRGAAQRMGDQLAPASLLEALRQTSAGGTAQTEAARLWELYTALWSSLGFAPEQGWSAAFREAALQHLAAVFDEVKN
jgi:type VI secretion system protein ImpI